MRNFISTLLFSLTCGLIMAQTTVSGVIMDESNSEPLIGANVMNISTLDGTITDVDGKFTIDVPENSGSLEVSFVGYKTVTITFESSGGSYDLGSIGVPQSTVGLEEVVITGTMDIVQDRRTPVAVSTIGLAEIQAKSVGNVEFPEVMKNTPSIYVSNQTGFGDSQMFTRGFGQTNTAFLLNGQPINGMEDGRMYWSNWSGMSDVASAVQVQRGLGSSKLAISSVGGTINIVTKTIDNDEGGFARFMVGNDGYLKGTFSYSSGLKGKWAYTVLLDHWQGNNKWAEGTRGQGQNYFLSVGYKPNVKNTFNFLVTGAPQWHGNRWSQSRETLEATPKFNQHWGEYDGEWESERRNFYHKPVLNLSWDNEISDKSSLSSVLYASYGRGGGTGPFGSSRNRVRTSAGQVDFDAIEANNLADSDGLGSFSGNYALRASMNNHQWYGNVTKYETQLSDQLNWSIGADFRWYTGDHFRQFANLLGLNGWQDSFRHATRDSDAIQSESFNPGPWTALFNFADEDQRIAYDYSEQINYQGGFTQLEYASDAFTFFAQGALSNQSYQREGRWADQGKSNKVSKIGYNIKGGASYSIDNKNIIFANAGLYSRQPFLDNIFTNIRYSNELITTGNGDGVDNEEIVGLEAGYKYNNDKFSFNANAYTTSWGNRTRVFTFTNENGTPDDESDDFAQRTVERGISQIHSGIELDVKYRMEDLTLKGFASFGDWTFDGIESVQTFNDDTGVEISNISGLDNSGVHIPNAPQTSFGLGLNYNVSSGFGVYLDYNYFNNLYINNINFDSGNQFLSEDQGTLDPYGIFDLGLSYKIDMDGNLLTLRGNIYNLLDADYLNQTDPFGFLNGNGRTWNLSAKYSFMGAKGKNASYSNKSNTSGMSKASGKMDSDGDGIKDSKDMCPDVAGERKFKGCPMEYNAYMAQLKAEEEARMKAEEEARMKAEMEAKAAAERAAAEAAAAKAAAEAQAKAAEEAKMKAEMEAKAAAEAEAKAAAARAEAIRVRNAELVTKFSAALRGLQFNSAQSSFKKASYAKMDEAVAILNQYSDIRILIQGHTDSQGDAEKNRVLSQKRADAVKEYLVSKGIATSRMLTNGLGEDNPIADNNTADGRAMNRRVEFIILR